VFMSAVVGDWLGNEANRGNQGLAARPCPELLDLKSWRKKKYWFGATVASAPSAAGGGTEPPAARSAAEAGGKAWPAVVTQLLAVHSVIPFSVKLLVSVKDSGYREICFCAQHNQFGLGRSVGRAGTASG
jgi:hypothetical protein